MSAAAMSPDEPVPAAADHTGTLVAYLLRYRAEALPADARLIARQCVLDWFGVTLGGVGEPTAALLRDERVPASRGDCAVVGTDLRVDPETAALLNGTASHALDYDDVNARMTGHPTVAIWPAVFAMAQAEGASGDLALRAFVAGYECAAILGSMICPAHYHAGFHATATIGAFGAAAAGGVLLGLDAARMRVALGIAGTQAAGLKSMFGTMVKPFHAGKAAAAGVLAARLARRGYSAHPGILDDAQGFVATQGRTEIPSKPWYPAVPGAEMRHNLFKYHSLCLETHSTIESVLAAKAAHGFDAEDVEKVEVHVPIGHFKVCNIPDPQTGLESKFSLRHATAMALAGAATSDPLFYTDENARRPDFVALRRRVEVVGDVPGPATSVRIVLRSGAVHEASNNIRTPAADLRAQGEKLAQKFRALAVPVLGAQRSAALENAILALDDAPDLHHLARLAQPALEN